jgi:hypothetical protein
VPHSIRPMWVAEEAGRAGNVQREAGRVNMNGGRPGYPEPVPTRGAPCFEKARHLLVEETKRGICERRMSRVAW